MRKSSEIISKYGVEDTTGCSIFAEISEVLESNDEAITRINAAMEILEEYGSIDRGHHKMWVIDQVVRNLLGDDYIDWVKDFEEEDESGEKQYDWDTGIAP